MDNEDDYTDALRQPDHASAGIARPFMSIDAFWAVSPDEDDGVMRHVHVVGIQDDGLGGFDFIVVAGDGEMIFVETKSEVYRTPPADEVDEKV